ncbi:hypothetical protein X739_28040 [Mesorhizobium sp. LNHC220B00]|nr:hypothetical protein X739_28040 [Mesorhizobium sp. LNHC220B00]
MRGAETFAFLQAINTGHPGSLTTVHANPPGPGGDMQPVLQIDEKKSGDPPELGQGVS